MQEFQAALDVLYADPNGSSGALYFAEGDPDGVEVRVILRHEELDAIALSAGARSATLFQTGAVTSGLFARVRQSEVAAQPAEGNRFVLDGGREYRVRVSRRDLQNLQWICDVDEVASS